MNIEMRPFPSGTGTGFRLAAPVVLAVGAENPFTFQGNLITPALLLQPVLLQKIADYQPDLFCRFLSTGSAVITPRVRLSPPFVGLPINLFGTVTSPPTTEWLSILMEYDEFLVAPANSYLELNPAAACTITDLFLYWA